MDVQRCSSSLFSFNQGNFFGWNFGLEAGFGGFLLVVILVTLFYICLCSSIAEMSAALPSSGGSVMFCYEAMGEWPAHLCGK